jgi:N-acetylglucosamine kinase-like BadF-type ATPase
MSSASLLLAVDGGGTKTQALVTDLEGKVLARGLGPSSNIHNVGLDESCRAVVTAIEGALMMVGPGPRAGASAGAGWRDGRFAAACFGLSGIDAPEDEAEVSRWVKTNTIAPRFSVVNDAELVLAAGTPDGWGIGLISGTGSVCLARSKDGRSARVGGWGPMIGDEGSGYHIAVSALRLATQAADGREPASGLLAGILKHWGLKDPASLIRHVHAPSMTPATLAGLATVVIDMGGRGDPAARRVLDDAARELARHVDTLVRKLGLEQPPLALSGGLLRASLRQAVLTVVTSRLGPVQYVADPPLGAVVLARRLLQGPPRR